MIEELKTELPLPGEPALEFPVIGSRELLLFKIEQIFTGPENSGIDIRRRALRNLSPENFIRSVKAAIEVAIADGLIPESTELSEYLDSLAVPGTRNSENKYPGRREREKRMEKMVNGVMQTLQTNHDVKLMDVLAHSIQELYSLLEELYGPSFNALLAEAGKEETGFEMSPDTDEVGTLKKDQNLRPRDALQTLRSIMILIAILGSFSLTQVACGGTPNEPAPKAQIVETMPPTPTSSESIELMAQHSGKLYYLRPGEGFDTVIWEVVNKHDPIAYPFNSGTDDGKMTYDQARTLLEIMNTVHNPIVNQPNGTKNFSNSGEMATVIVPSWIPDPIHYKVYEATTKEESYIIQQHDTLDAIATKLGIVDKNAWYKTIKINGSPVADINAIPADGVITWTVAVPASYTP